MKKILPLLLMNFICQLGISQNKLFTTKETETAGRLGLVPENLRNLQWRGSLLSFTYQRHDTLFQQNVTDSHSFPLYTLIQINKFIKATCNDTLSKFPSIIWNSDSTFCFSGLNTWFFYDVQHNNLSNLIRLPEESENTEWFYAEQKVAYTIKNNIFLIKANEKPLQITFDDNPDIVNGSIVSRSEFGISKGLFWSPKGKYLAFYRKDNRDVGNYPLVDITSREAELKMIKYPMAGMKSEHVSVGIYNVSTGKTIFIEKNDSLSEKYLTNLSWSPDEHSLYIQVLNRRQDTMKLNQYSIVDGTLTRTLFSEHNTLYIEPLNPLLFLHHNPDQFIYQSRRDGYNHAYVYNIHGEMVKQLTFGNWEITGILELDDQDNLYYASTEESPIQNQIYQINSKSGKKTKLTLAEGTHTAYISKKKGYWIDSYSSITIPRIINLVNSNGKVICNLLTSKNPLIDYNMPKVTIGTLKAADGITNLYYRLIKPLDFDSTHKYPVILYVYGGPHEHLIQDKWQAGARLWDYMMAQKGYIVFSLDNRGSEHRGFAFESVIHGQCGVEEMKDQLKGISFLQSQGYTDMKRIGVHGWSYGGFMTISLMTNYPDVFKVGVAGGPVIDWKNYEVMYGERYMGNPASNPQGYKKTSLVEKASNLKGKLLIIHGAVDNTVVCQQSMRFIQACITSQIPVDYFIYPLSEHNVFGSDRIHLTNKITQYFEDNL